MQILGLRRRSGKYIRLIPNMWGWALLALGVTAANWSARRSYTPSYTPRTYPSGSYPSALAPTRIPTPSYQVRRRAPIQSALQPYVGQRAPDLSLADLDGNLHSLSGNKGKVVLLHFWAPG
jgi:hypothetical protein